MDWNGLPFSCSLDAGIFFLTLFWWLSLSLVSFFPEGLGHLSKRWGICNRSLSPRVLELKKGTTLRRAKMPRRKEKGKTPKRVRETSNLESLLANEKQNGGEAKKRKENPIASRRQGPAWCVVREDLDAAVLQLASIRVDLIEKFEGPEDFPEAPIGRLLMRVWKQRQGEVPRGEEKEILFVATCPNEKSDWVRGDWTVTNGSAKALFELAKIGCVGACFEPEKATLDLWLRRNAVSDDENFKSYKKLGRLLETALKAFNPSGINPIKRPPLPISWFYDAIRRRSDDSDKPIDEYENPSDLIPILRNYQKRAVNFMLARENVDTESESPNLHPSWAELTSKSNTPLFIEKVTKKLSWKRPSGAKDARGGILADEMGLGKTVELLSVILRNKRPESDLRLGSEIAEDVFLQAPFLASTDDKKSSREQGGEEDEIVPSRNILSNSEHDKDHTCGICSSNSVPEDDSKFLEYSVISTFLRCGECGLKAHAYCVGVTERSTLMGITATVYVCDRCLDKPKESEQYKARATLIIVPSALRRQWLDEILKHTKTKSTKIVYYDGLRSGAFFPARIMAQADIVVTTYDALRSDFTHADPDTRASSLRYEKKYRMVPSPLMMINWWRICLDEAQMVENDLRVASQMAMRLSGEIKWCVSGTPAQFRLNQLVGLFQFLNVEPYASPLYWNELLMNLSEVDLRYFFRKYAWRTNKEDVAGELGLPPQGGQIWRLSFSPVEAFYYRRQHEDVRETAGTFLKSESGTSQLTGKGHGNILSKLTRLRQACCHPQIGGYGLRSLPGSSNDTITMSEVVEALMRKAKVECEDAFRLYVAATNGVAGCCLLSGGKDLARAIELYRETLKDAEENASRFQMDSIQRLHILHNLGSALDQVDRELKSENLDRDTQDELKAIGRTLREGWIPDEVKAIKQEYSRDATNKLIAAKYDFEKLNEKIGKETNFYTWWLEALAYITEDKATSEDLLHRMQSERAEILMDNHTFGSQLAEVRSLHGLQFVLTREIDSLEETRNQLIQSLTSLPGHKTQTPQQVLESGSCKRCRPMMTGEICEHCKAEPLFRAYEKCLFSFRERKISSKTANAREGVAALSSEGIRLQSELEKILKMILTYVKKTPVPADELSSVTKSAQEFFGRLDLFKKELSQCHVLFSAQKDLLSALDEVEMSLTRIQVRSPDDKVEEHEKLYKLLPEEVPVMNVSYSNDRATERENLKRKKGQLTYLSSLRQVATKSGETDEKRICAICLNDCGDQFSVFPCGHFFCFDCTARVVENKLLVTHNQTTHIRCPSCRSLLAIGEISYVRSEEGDGKQVAADLELDVEGSFGTKITAVTRIIKSVLRSDPSQRFLIFSQWNDLLEIVAKALTVNGVPNVKTAGGKKSLQSSIDAFKKNAEITALLLPMKSCASGLNIVEATQVILMEPQLNPAAEAQAVGRVHRFGQKKETTVHHFIVNNTIEERVLEIGRAKHSYSSPISSNIAEKISADDISKMFEQA